jgi:hypothetical protein
VGRPPRASHTDGPAGTDGSHLSSTAYALANPGQEYLVLQPSGAADPFTVTLEPGTYTAEWFAIQGRETVPAAATTVDRPMATSFSPPPQASGPLSYI